MAGWLAVTFVYCVETVKDTAIVAGMRIGNCAQSFERYYFQ